MHSIIKTTKTTLFVLGAIVAGIFLKLSWFFITFLGGSLIAGVLFLLLLSPPPKEDKEDKED